MILLSAGYFVASDISRSVTPLTDTATKTEVKVAALSARRTPNNLSVITRSGKLQRALASFPQLLPNDSCVKVDWLGKTLLSVNSSQVFIPASTTKVVTAVVALEVLTNKKTFTTTVKADSSVAGGVVNNLYLVGGGDPVLSRSEYAASEKYPTRNPTSLEKLADNIVTTGVRQVTGSIVVDDSRYDSKRFVDIWPDDFHFTESGPLGALVVDDGVVLGQIMKPEDPAIAAATELQVLLAARGVFIAVAPQRGNAPVNSVDVASVTSAPLDKILTDMLTNSDNNTAELLVKEIGFVSKKDGSTAAGLQKIQEVLSSWGMKDLVLNDGSGLSSENRVSCDSFMKLLERGKEQLPPLLAVAGESGTMRDLFESSPLKARLLGKTGTLNGVKTLIGYVPLASGDPVIFSLLMTRAGIDNQSAYRSIWNGLAEDINAAKAEPRTDQLAP